jgi:hypothetical protein
MDEGFLERVWEYREAMLFPRLFGGVSRGNFVVPYDMFAKTFGQNATPKYAPDTGRAQADPPNLYIS